VQSALDAVTTYMRKIKGAAHDAQVRAEQARLAVLAEKRRVEAEKEEAKRLAAIWTRDELSLLAKATTKYPPGTKNRWEVVAAAIGTRSAAEVIAKTKELQAR
jgi:hypothetical protein